MITRETVLSETPARSATSLIVGLRAPLIALLGTVVSLLSTAAAFGVARVVFQEGWGSGLLGFESQGFLDAWAPVFFFAMIFAIAMDYTVFLLASAKEHWERSGDAEEAMVGSLAHSGRVIFAAGAVMVAVFFTFALSGPLPPKEMGVVLGLAVLLDAFLVRLVLLPVLLRLTGGRWATTLVFPSAVLETRGARTGQVRRNAVIYFHDGDRVILMLAGRIEQNGTPAELYEKPATVFTARFIGAPPMNVIPASALTGRPALAGAPSLASSASRTPA